MMICIRLLWLFTSNNIDNDGGGGDDSGDGGDHGGDIDYDDIA